MKKYILTSLIALGLMLAPAASMGMGWFWNEEVEEAEKYTTVGDQMLGLLIEDSSPADGTDQGFVYKIVVPDGILAISGAIGTLTIAGAGDIVTVGDDTGTAGATFTAAAAGNNLVFEGATANAYDTTLTAADPGANYTITLPATTGTVVLGPADFATDHALIRTELDAANEVTLMQVSGIIVDDSDNVSGVGTLASGAITSTGAVKGTSIVLEGGTYDTTIGPGTPTASQSYTWPLAAPGASGYALTSTTGGVMSWSSAGAGDVSADAEYRDDFSPFVNLRFVFPGHPAFPSAFSQDRILEIPHRIDFSGQQVPE